MSCSSIGVLYSYAREMSGTQVNYRFLLILAKIGMCQCHISVQVTNVKFGAGIIFLILAHSVYKM